MKKSFKDIVRVVIVVLSAAAVTLLAMCGVIMVLISLLHYNWRAIPFTITVRPSTVIVHNTLRSNLTVETDKNTYIIKSRAKRGIPLQTCAQQIHIFENRLVFKGISADKKIAKSGLLVKHNTNNKNGYTIVLMAGAEGQPDSWQTSRVLFDELYIAALDPCAIQEITVNQQSLNSPPQIVISFPAGIAYPFYRK